MSAGHVLLASVFYLRQEDGSRKRYRTGDVVVGLSEAEAKRLIKIGAVASAESVPSSPQPAADGGDPRPKHVALKAEWVDYAVAKGADREGAEEMTKAELIEMYGG